MVKIANLLAFFAVFLTSCKKEEETILPPQHDLSISAVSPAEGEAATGNSSGVVEEKYTVKEVFTHCQYRSDGLRVLIQFDSDKLPTDQTAYLLALIPGAEEGKTVTIDQDNESSQVLIFVRPKTEPTPKTTDTPFNYTTRQSQGTFTNKRPPSSCAFTLTKMQQNAETRGSLECSDLAQFDEISNAELIPLGEILDITAEWQCDGYQQQ